MNKIKQSTSSNDSFHRTSENYVLYYYVKPYTRYGPFLIGILLGIYLSTRKDPLVKHKVRPRDYFDSHPCKH